MESSEVVRKDQSPLNELATLGGGCFWCLEAVFLDLKGVVKVESGYSGGVVSNPTYRQVCNGTTGHAEVIQVSFDSKIISFKEILEVFLSIHDPTTMNQQGADIGTQYRSVIFYHNSQQQLVAKQVIDDFNKKKVWDDPIVTQVAPLQEFYKAEDYHQEYFLNNVDQPYCRFAVAPKVAKFRKQFIEKLKK